MIISSSLKTLQRPGDKGEINIPQALMGMFIGGLTYLDPNLGGRLDIPFKRYYLGFRPFISRLPSWS